MASPLVFPGFSKVPPGAVTSSGSQLLWVSSWPDWGCSMASSWLHCFFWMEECHKKWPETEVTSWFIIVIYSHRMGLQTHFVRFFPGLKMVGTIENWDIIQKHAGRRLQKGSFHYRLMIGFMMEVSTVRWGCAATFNQWGPFLWDFWESDVPRPATRQPYTNAPEDVDDHGEAVHCTKYLQTDAGQKRGYRTNITHIYHISHIYI